MRGFLKAAAAAAAAAALAGLAAASPTTTTTVTLTVPPSAALGNPHALPPATRATLTTLYATYAAPLTVAHTFVFGNVTPGSYLADVHCATHAFAPLRIDVTAAVVVDPAQAAAEQQQQQPAPLLVQAWETFRGNDWNNKGEAVREVVVAGRPALPVRALGAKGYFVERGTFSVLSILKNPMILLAMVSMGLFFVMPKLVENMDPEMRAEFEAQQKSNPMSSLMGGGGGGGGAAAANPMGSFDMASFLAGSKKEGGGAPAAEGANPGGNGGNGGNGGKKSRK